MNINNRKGVAYLTFDIYKNEPIISVHSTRLGGVSQSHFKSMNLGFSRGDERSHVHRNYELFTDVLEVPVEKLVLSDQWHHNHILDVKEEHCGMGIFKDRNYSDVDGLITNIIGIPLVTFYADCVPIYYYDSEKKVIAMTHAGWRGTSTAIVRDMIKKMVDEYGCNTNNIKVAIGPAICKSCYEVDKQVIDSMTFDFASKYYDYHEDKDKYHIDLKGINMELARACGILIENIEVTNYCTKCQSELLFSHRAHGNNRGTQIGLMMLKG